MILAGSLVDDYKLRSFRPDARATRWRRGCRMRPPTPPKAMLTGPAMQWVRMRHGCPDSHRGVTNPTSPARVSFGLPEEMLPQRCPGGRISRLEATWRRGNRLSSDDLPATPVQIRRPCLSAGKKSHRPLAHFPRSIVRQRSLQKGKSAPPLLTGFLQIGHFNWR